MFNEISKNDIPLTNKNKNHQNKDKIVYHKDELREKKLI